MMKPVTKMMSYQKSPSSDEDEETADVPLVTTILPSTTTMTTTMSSRSSKSMGMLAIVAGTTMIMLGSTVLLQNGETAAEGLVVATEGTSPCLAAPMDTTFGGTSITNRGGIAGRTDPFETCYQYYTYEKYCWSKSFYLADDGVEDDFRPGWMQCFPDGGGWNTVDPQYVNPVTHPYSCGKPCQYVSHYN